MKKTLFAPLAILFFILSACGSTPPPTGNTDQAASNSQVAEIVNQNLTADTPIAIQTPVAIEAGELNTSYDNAVSIELQLLLGIFKIKGTDLAVTKEQAAILQPLWANLKTLNQNMVPAMGRPGQGQGDVTPQAQGVNAETQAQIEATVKQIQAAMTPEQIKAIADMKITRETAMTIMQEQGIQMNGPQQGNVNKPGGQPAQGTHPAGNSGGGNMGSPQQGMGNNPGGQSFQGTPPAGGPGEGQQPANGQIPQMGTGNDRPGGGFVPTEWIEALIQLLANTSAN